MHSVLDVWIYTCSHQQEKIFLKYTRYIYTAPCNLKYFSKFQKLYIFGRLKIILHQKGVQQLGSIEKNTRQNLTCSYMRIFVVVYLDEIFFTIWNIFYNFFLKMLLNFSKKKKKKVEVHANWRSSLFLSTRTPSYLCGVQSIFLWRLKATVEYV